MDVIRKLIFLVVFIPFVSFGQKKIYPKDTIYLKFRDTVFKNPNMKAKSNHFFKEEYGIKFWWRGKWLFYRSNMYADTLGIQYLRDYKFSNLKEIDEKERLYYKKRFGGNPWIKNKNAVFQTYLIEVISKEQLVIYPVIWRSQGVID
jgi:hypothetical protein